jgi:hypothetical protein
LLQHFDRRHAGYEKGGLADHGRIKLFLWTFETNVLYGVTQNVVGLLEQLFNTAMVVKSLFAHADRLSTLTWKQKCNFAHGWIVTFEADEIRVEIMTQLRLNDHHHNFACESQQDQQPKQSHQKHPRCFSTKKGTLKPDLKIGLVIRAKETCMKPSP